MKTIVGISLLVIFLSATSFAGESSKGWSNKTGNDLLPTCSLAVDFLDEKNLSADQAYDAIACLSYIGGFLDGYGKSSFVEGGKPQLCYESGTSTGQILRVVFKWLKDHPEKLNESSSDCVFHALFDAFACKYPK